MSATQPAQDAVRGEDSQQHILPACPEGRPVMYSLCWYTLYDRVDTRATGHLVSYLICTRCHTDHIKDSVLASRFISQERPNGSATFCCFSLPRVSNILWPRALSSRNTDEIREFMMQRATVKPCRGTESVTSDYTKSLGMVAGEINGFRVCHACFEDRIVDTVFQDKFSVYTDTNTVQWVCHVGSAPLVANMLSVMAQTNNWPGFVYGISKRLTLEACTGEQRQWGMAELYLPVDRNLAGVQLCQRCYLDHIYHGPFRHEFRWYKPSQVQQYSRHTNTWSCLYADGDNLGIALALERAKQKRDFTIFSTAAKIIISVPRCTSDGIVGGNWWSLQSGGAFVLCTSCHAGLSAFGLGSYFRSHQVDPQVAILCGLCPSSPRGGDFLLKLIEALDRGVFTYFSNYVMKFAGVPACPRLKAVSNATWWGYPEVLFCEECFLEFVADTSLGLSLPLRQETSENMQICQIWSDRMRALWLQACAAGEPGSTESDDAVQHFRLIGAQRQQVCRATILEIEATEELQKAKQQEVAFFNQMYVKWNETAALIHVQQSMNGTSEGLVYGNSSLGYFDTYAGAEAQKFFNKMKSTVAELNILVDPARVSRLMEQWNEVE